MKILSSLGSFLLLSALSPAAFAQEKWKGVDESIIEKFAQDRGRISTEPFISVEGDMLLFLFALAGAIGGFIVGYYWHKLFVSGKKEQDK